MVNGEPHVNSAKKHGTNMFLHSANGPTLKLLGIFSYDLRRKKVPGWWQLKYFLFSPPFGEDVHPF